jgi:hypothetical protein
MLSRTMVAQSFFDLLAAEAAVKVQLARFWSATAFLRSGTGVGIGFAETKTDATLRASPSVRTK